MKNTNITMVNPQQIVNKGLKGCKSTRTVTTFAQKFGVPCVWWRPTTNQKVLLVDWPQFRTIWNQHWNTKTSTQTTTTWKGTGTWGTGTNRTSCRASTRPSTTRTHTRTGTERTGYGNTRTATKTYRTTNYRRTRRAA